MRVDWRWRPAAGLASPNRGAWHTSRTRCRSESGQRPRLLPVGRRHRCRPGWRRGAAVPPVVGGLGSPARPTGAPGAEHRGQLGDRRVDHLLEPGEQGGIVSSVSALSERVSQSACSFPCTSITNWALASSASAWPSPCGAGRSRARGLSNNRTASGVSGPTRAELPPSTVPMRVSGVCGGRRGRRWR